jgi:hypothetical protein
MGANNNEAAAARDKENHRYYKLVNLANQVPLITSYVCHDIYLRIVSEGCNQRCIVCINQFIHKAFCEAHRVPVSCQSRRSHQTKRFRGNTPFVTDMCEITVLQNKSGYAPLFNVKIVFQKGRLAFQPNLKEFSATVPNIITALIESTQVLSSQPVVGTQTLCSLYHR